MKGCFSSDRGQHVLRWVQFAVVLISLGGWLFSWLQSTQEFSYFYREQQQIFLYDASYIHELLMQVGGVGLVASQFLIQFFVLPYMGALISTLITLATGCLLWLTLQKLNNNMAWMPLAFVPPVLYNIYLSDNYAHYDGLVALLALAFLLWVYTLLYSAPLWGRCVATCLFSIGLFFGFGSVAMLFAWVVLHYDVLQRAPKWWLSASALAVVMVVGLVANHLGWVVTPAYAFWMKGYVEYFFEPTSLYSMAWLSLLGIMLWIGLSAWLRFSICGVAAVGSMLVLLLAIPFIAQSLSKNHLDTNMRDMQQVAHYCNQGEWDKVIALAQSHTGNYIFLNYLNFANAQKGQLLDRLFTIPQQGSQSLIMETEQYAEIDMLLARLYYHIGEIGQSQCHAFSSNMGVAYGSPAMMQQMVVNHLVIGQYQVAEKILKMLEKSWYYADWARARRRFLYDDKAIEADPELGRKRKDLPGNEGFILEYNSLSDVYNVVVSNPSERAAVEYIIAMMLLDKDFNAVKQFVEEQYGIVEIWPVCLQEAIVAYSEKDMDYCRQYGVSEEIIQRFAQFRQETLAMRHGGGSLSQLASKWGKTFWYYTLKTTKK